MDKKKKEKSAPFEWTKCVDDERRRLDEERRRGALFDEYIRKFEKMKYEYVPEYISPVPVFFDEAPLEDEVTKGDKLYYKAMEERREGRIKAGVEALATGWPLTASGWADALTSPTTLQAIVAHILNAADKWEEGWD